MLFPWPLAPLSSPHPHHSLPQWSQLHMATCSHTPNNWHHKTGRGLPSDKGEGAQCSHGKQVLDGEEVKLSSRREACWRPNRARLCQASGGYKMITHVLILKDFLSSSTLVGKLTKKNNPGKVQLGGLSWGWGQLGSSTLNSTFLFNPLNRHLIGTYCVPGPALGSPVQRTQTRCSRDSSEPTAV